jgi:hypothetical protein
MSVENNTILRFTDRVTNVQHVIPIAHICDISKYDEHVTINIVNGSTYDIPCFDSSLYEKISESILLYYINLVR